MNEKNMKAFAKQFEEKIIPTIRGTDGKGLERLRLIVDKKREEVEKRKEKRLRFQKPPEN